MSQFRSSGGDLNPFREPPWDAPLDVQREIDTIPSSAQIRGMFILPIVQEAKRLGVNLTGRERYVGFQFYPLREHAALLADACGVFYPKLPLRAALRKLGRGAPKAFVSSTLGRVVLQSVQGVPEIIGALAKGYELSLRPGRAVVEQVSSRAVHVTLEHVYYYLDSHHVGAFEGAATYAGKRARVRIHRIDVSQAVLRVEW